MWEAPDWWRRYIKISACLQAESREPNSPMLSAMTPR
jgi:hypothetical protein